MVGHDPTTILGSNHLIAIMVEFMVIPINNGWNVTMTTTTTTSSNKATEQLPSTSLAIAGQPAG